MLILSTDTKQNIHKVSLQDFVLHRNAQNNGLNCDMYAFDSKTNNQCFSCDGALGISGKMWFLLQKMCLHTGSNMSFCGNALRMNKRKLFALFYGINFLQALNEHLHPRKHCLPH